MPIAVTVFAVLIFFTIILIIVSIQNKKIEYYKSQEYLHLVAQINAFLAQIGEYRKDYITYSIKQRLLSDNEQLRKCCEMKLVLNGDAFENVNRLIDIYDNMDYKVYEWYKDYVELEMAKKC